MTYQTPMSEGDTKRIDDDGELADRERMLEFVDQYIADHRELYDKLEDE